MFKVDPAIMFLVCNIFDDQATLHRSVGGPSFSFQTFSHGIA